MIEGILILYNDKKEEVNRYNALRLPLDKETITRLSTNFYNEPEPCMVYISAITKRVGMEIIRDVERKNKSDEMMSVDELNEFLNHVVVIPDGVSYGKII